MTDERSILIGTVARRTNLTQGMIAGVLAAIESQGYEIKNKYTAESIGAQPSTTAVKAGD